MKINKAKRIELSNKLNAIATNVAKKNVFVVSLNNGCYDVLEYFSKNIVLGQIPSKNLARHVCESLNNTKQIVKFKELQHYLDVYSKHYYDCEFYKHTIKTTKDRFKKEVTITRLDMAIEYLKLAASQIRKSC